MAHRPLLAPILSAVTARQQKVYIKSRARRLGVDLTFAITLCPSGSDLGSIEGPLQAAVTELNEAMEGAGLVVLSRGEDLQGPGG
jgi:hypothetical protein